MTIGVLGYPALTQNREYPEAQGGIHQANARAGGYQAARRTCLVVRAEVDGYRALGVKANGRVRLFSRNGIDFSDRFATIARALEALPDETVIAEIITYGADGRPSFNRPAESSRRRARADLYVFDLLTLCGTDEGTDAKARFLQTKVMPLTADSIATRKRWTHRRPN